MFQRITLRCMLLAACLVPALALAQAYPSRAIRLIVPYAPGGNTDIVARIFGQKLAERTGQPVVFDNRGGAAGSLGMGIAAKAPNDGYTIVIGDLGSLVIANHAVPALPYQAQKDFAAIALVTGVSIVVSATPKSPFNSFEDILARAREQPGKLSYGTSGIGSPSHLAMELVRAIAKVDMLHVPFKGGAQAVTALLGEQVDFLVDGTALAQVKGGKLKAIAVTGPRLPALPDTPGIGETLKDFSFTNWWGFLAPVGAPAEAVNKLNDEFRQIAALPEIRDRLSALGLAAQSGTPQQFAEHLRTETEKVERIVRESRIRFE